MIKVSIKKNNIKNKCFLKPKEFMHRDFWDEKVLLPEISDALLEIANSIIDTMEIESEIKDIVVTGSIAGYNWHPLSDIDLHIVFDFEEIDENFELVKRMLDQSRINWNKAHNIRIKGHEVELYFQDANEPHESKGIWSLTKNIWNVEPIQEKDVDLDLRNAEKKAECMAKAIDHLEDIVRDNPEEAYKYASKIKNKVSEMRSAGLSREGVYSPENLAFKMLRNSNYLKRLSNIKISSYDRMLSLNEMYIKDYFNKKNESDYMEFEGKYNLEDLLDPNGSAPWGEIEKQKNNLNEQEGGFSIDREVPHEEPEEEEFNPEDMSGDPTYELAAFTGQFRLERSKSFSEVFSQLDLDIFKKASFEILDTAAMFVDLTGQYMGTNYETGKANDPAYVEYQKAVKQFLKSKNDSSISRLGKATMVVFLGLSMIPALGALGKISIKLSKGVGKLSNALRKAHEGNLPQATVDFQNRILQFQSKLRKSGTIPLKVDGPRRSFGAKLVKNEAFMKDLTKKLGTEGDAKKYDYYIHTTSTSSGVSRAGTRKTARQSQDSIETNGLGVPVKGELPGNILDARHTYEKLDGDTLADIARNIASSNAYVGKADYITTIFRAPKGVNPAHKTDGILVPARKNQKVKYSGAHGASGRTRDDRRVIHTKHGGNFSHFIPPKHIAVVIDTTGGQVVSYKINK